jgi:hypothetical protein
VLGDALWERFRAGSGDSVRWYYRSLAAEFAARADDLGAGAGPALEELQRTVRELDALAGGGRPAGPAAPAGRGSGG